MSPVLETWGLAWNSTSPLILKFPENLASKAILSLQLFTDLFLTVLAQAFVIASVFLQWLPNSYCLLQSWLRHVFQALKLQGELKKVFRSSEAFGFSLPALGSCSAYWCGIQDLLRSYLIAHFSPVVLLLTAPELLDSCPSRILLFFASSLLPLYWSF